MDMFNGRWGLILFTAIIVIVLNYAFLGAERFFSSDRFCTSCHSMSYPAQELGKSKHFGPLGIRPRCQDCHIPRGFFPRMRAHIEEGGRDTIGEILNGFGTKEKFDEKRAELAHISRVNLKKNGSSPCKTCHRAVHRPDEESGAAKKDAGIEAVTCIDCHQNLVHEKVPEENLLKGIKEGRIVLK